MFVLSRSLQVSSVSSCELDVNLVPVCPGGLELNISGICYIYESLKQEQQKLIGLNHTYGNT